MVVWLVKDGRSTVMLLMTLFTTESNKKSCPEKTFIITTVEVQSVCRGVRREAPGGHMWLTTDIRQCEHCARPGMGWTKILMSVW